MCVATVVIKPGEWQAQRELALEEELSVAKDRGAELQRELEQANERIRMIQQSQEQRREQDEQVSVAREPARAYEDILIDESLSYSIRDVWRAFGACVRE